MRPGGADREHAPHADLARRGIDADFDEVRAEGRLLVASCRGRRIRSRPRRRARRRPRPRASGTLRLPARTCAVREHRVGGVEAELLRDGLAQLHAGGIDAGGRVVARPTARPSRPRPGRSSRRAARRPCRAARPSSRPRSGR